MQLQRFMASYIVGGLGLLASFAIFLLISDAQESRSQDLLERQAGSYAQTIQERLNGYMLALRSTRALFVGSQAVTLGEFQAFAAPIGRHNPGLIGIGWLSIVDQEDRRAFEAGVSHHLDSGYPIIELRPDGRLTQAGLRPWYAPMHYVPPKQAMMDARGVDFASLPGMRAILERARDGAEIIATPATTLISLPGVIGTGKMGVRLIIPVYGTKRDPVSLAERRATLKGFGIAVFSLSGLLQLDFGGGAGLAESQFHSFLFDVTTPKLAKTPLISLPRHESPETAHSWTYNQPRTGRYVASQIITLADRKFELVLRPGAAFSDPRLDAIPWLGLLGGLIISGLLAGYLALLGQRNRDIREQVEAKTAELTSANERLAREVKERQRAEYRAEDAHATLMDALDSMPGGWALWDKNDRLVLWNHQFKVWFGTDMGEIKAGQTFEDCLRTAYYNKQPEQGVDAKTLTIEERLRAHRDGTGRMEIGLSDDRWLQITDRHTKRGATVSNYTSITSRVRAERRLRDANQTLAAVIEASPQPICMLDANGNVKLWNRAAEDVFGWSAEEVLDRRVPFVPESYAGRPGPLRKILDQRRERVMMELRRHKKDGSPIDIAVSAAPLLTPEGEISSYVAIMVDVTSRKQAEQRLKEANETLAAVIEASPLPTYLMNPDGTAKLWNPAAEKLFGWRADEVVGRRLPYTPDDKIDEIDMVRTRILQERRLIAQQVTRQTKGGKLVELQIYVAPVFNAEGEMINYVATAVDITEQKNTEQALRDAKEAAEMANRTKSEFLANMSHELRTPLNAVIGFSDIMAKELFGELGSTHYKEYANDIHQSGRHLLGIINDILDLAKIEAGKVELIEEVIDPAEVINSSLRLVRERAENSEVSLEADLPARLPYIRADERKLKQILINLLSNAVKFTPSGGRVTIGAQMTPAGELAVAINDTGIGMEREDIETAMALFGQIDSALNRKYAGTGLGLPLTRSLIELHGGALHIQSEVNVGTTATITMPVDRIVESTPPRRTASN